MRVSTTALFLIAVPCFAQGRVDEFLNVKGCAGRQSRIVAPQPPSTKRD
jgi:hypothetical protein